MTNRRKSGSGPGLFEDQEPCLFVSMGADASLKFDSDDAHPDAAQRAHRLVALLRWFPLPVEAAEQVLSPARTERLTLEDVALHLWGLNTEPHETPLAQQSEPEFKEYLAGLGMLPRWFGRPAFLRHHHLVAMAKAQANMLRSFDLSGYDEAEMIGRLRRAGWTERMVGQEIPFDELRRPAFPILARRAPDPQQQGHFDYLREALAQADGLISLADVEQLLLDRKRGEYGWFREYTN